MRANLEINGVRAGIQIQPATTWMARALGLLIHRDLSASEGLWLRPCASVHTFGMAYVIDVVFLDAQNKVQKIVADLKPGRLAVARGACSVLEFRAGLAARLGLRLGDRVRVVEVQLGTDG